MQSEFTALQGALHDLTNLKQEFIQTRIFKLIISNSISERCEYNVLF